MIHPFTLTSVLYIRAFCPLSGIETGFWPVRLVTALLLILLCTLQNMHAIHGSNLNPHCQNRFSSPAYLFSGCKAAPFCHGNTLNPLLSCFYDYFFPPHFYVVSFREDDASKEPWHIKRSHVPKADFSGKLAIYIFTSHSIYSTVVR